MWHLATPSLVTPRLLLAAYCLWKVENACALAAREARVGASFISDTSSDTLPLYREPSLVPTLVPWVHFGCDIRC